MKTTRIAARFAAGIAAVTAAALAPCAAQAGNKDWPTYNRTLTSDRYVTLSDIDAGNAAHLKIV